MRVKEESEKAVLKLMLRKKKKTKKLRTWYSVPPLHCKLKGEKWKQWQILLSWAPKSLWMVTAGTKLKDACSLEEKP